VSRTPAREAAPASAGARRDGLTLQVLLAGCARRDRDAFARLYRSTSRKLFGLALRIVGREAVAEEVLQEAYVQIWRDAERFDPAYGEAMTWMAGIVRHRAIDAVRRRRPEVSASGDDDARIPEPSEWPQHVDALALRHCLEELGPEQQRSITLAYYAGMTHVELSRALAAPVGTVKSWIRRGLVQLKGCLER
jgi:RNA polymerase sigma-70 factor (ECF subfamily)